MPKSVSQMTHCAAQVEIHTPVLTFTCDSFLPPNTTGTMALSVTLDKTLKVGPAPESTELRESLLEGLSATAPHSLPQGYPGSISWRKHLPLRTLYEFEGINFYEAITQDPDYYLYRNEVNLLRRCVDKVAYRIQNPDVGEQCHPDRPVSQDSLSFIDLGAGRTEKAALLLRECSKNREGLDLKYWPIDLQYDLLESRLAELADSLTDRRAAASLGPPPRRHGDHGGGAPNRIQLRGICGSWFDALGRLARGRLPGLAPSAAAAADRHCYLWLGSSLTNMTPAEGVGFLGRLARECLRPQDTLLVGVDVCRDVAAVLAAYGTPRWHAYIANGLGNARRILGDAEASAPFGNPARDWEYVACWDPVDSRHVRFARSKTASTMRIPTVGEGAPKAVRTIEFEEGEHVLLGQSYKWRRETVEAIFREAGLGVYDAWFDARQETGIYLLGNRPS